MILDEFLYPHHHRHQNIDPMVIAFTEELERFAQQVSYTCNLETGGKLSPRTAYERLETLWEHLKQAKEDLGVE